MATRMTSACSVLGAPSRRTGVTKTVPFGPSLPVPRTIVCQCAAHALEGFESLGGNIVVKPLFGSEGRGLLHISERELAWRTFHVLERLGAVIYLQEFIDHPGWDLRVFVLNGDVRAAMRRSSNSDWRTNIAQGGVAERAEVASAECRLAIDAARAVGAHLAGIDLIMAGDGHFRVLEVNAVPGWRSLAAVTGIDVAAPLVEYVAQGI